MQAPPMLTRQHALSVGCAIIRRMSFSSKAVSRWTRRRLSSLRKPARSISCTIQRRAISRRQFGMRRRSMRLLRFPKPWRRKFGTGCSSLKSCSSSTMEPSFRFPMCPALDPKIWFFWAVTSISRARAMCWRCGRICWRRVLAGNCIGSDRWAIPCKARGRGAPSAPDRASWQGGAPPDIRDRGIIQSPADAKPCRAFRHGDGGMHGHGLRCGRLDIDTGTKEIVHAPEEGRFAPLADYPALATAAMAMLDLGDAQRRAMARRVREQFSAGAMWGRYEVMLKR